MDGEHIHDKSNPWGLHNHKKTLIFGCFALILALAAYSVAQKAQTAANINNIYYLVDNNTNLGCGEGGLCTIQPNVVYWSNDSVQNLYMKFHVVSNNVHVVANITVNGTIKQWKDFTTVQSDQNDSMFVQIPRGSNFTIKNSSNVHHVEIYLSQVLSGKNGTLSLNQTFITQGTSFNATYDLTTTEYNSNYSSQNFPNSSLMAYSNVRSKLITVTHDISVTGDQAITGTGFTPKGVTIYALVPGITGATSWGLLDGDSNAGFVLYATPTAGQYSYNTGALIYLSPSVGVQSYALWKSFDSNGMTITWSKTGLPTGTATLLIRFDR